MTLRCPDGPGIVHALTGVVVSLGGNITECQQFASADTGRFFTRIALVGPTRDELMGALRRGGGARRGVRHLRHATPDPHPVAGLEGRALPQRTSVPVARGNPAHRRCRCHGQSRSLGVAGRFLRCAVHAPGGRSRDQGRFRGRGSARDRGAEGGPGGSGPLHADPQPRAVRSPCRARNQHPPLLPARFQGGPIPTGRPTSAG